MVLNKTSLEQPRDTAVEQLKDIEKNNHERFQFLVVNALTERLADRPGVEFIAEDEDIADLDPKEVLEQIWRYIEDKVSRIPSEQDMSSVDGKLAIAGVPLTPNQVEELTKDLTFASSLIEETLDVLDQISYHTHLDHHIETEVMEGEEADAQPILRAKFEDEINGDTLQLVREVMNDLDAEVEIETTGMGQQKRITVKVEARDVQSVNQKLYDLGNARDSDHEVEQAPMALVYYQRLVSRGEAEEVAIELCRKQCMDNYRNSGVAPEEQLLHTVNGALVFVDPVHTEGGNYGHRELYEKLAVIASSPS